MVELHIVKNEPGPGGMLPGFEPPPKKPGPITESAKRTIEWLKDQGALDGRHDLQIELILSAALAVDDGLRSPRPTIATTNLYGKLVELLDKLPVPTADTDEADNAFWAAVGAAAPTKATP